MHENTITSSSNCISLDMENECLTQSAYAKDYNRINRLNTTVSQSKLDICSLISPEIISSDSNLFLSNTSINCTKD